MPYSETEQKHLNHQFYKDAKAYIEKMRIGQILKGANKYPEPFTTASWTSEQIIQHAMQENVDQAHYIYAAMERMWQLEKDLLEAEQLVKWQYQQLQKTKVIIRELKSLNRVSKCLQLEEENLRLAREIEKLRGESPCKSK
jgi:predicted lipoprotein